MFKNIMISRMMRDIQWSFISITISSFVYFLLRIVLGKELGAYGLGIYTLVFTIYLLGMQFATFGIGNALTQYTAERNDNIKKTNEFVSIGLVGSVISGLITAIIIYLFSDTIGIDFFHNFAMGHLLKITAVCFPFIALQKAVLGTLNGLRKMKYYALLNIVQSAIILLISIILVIPLKMQIIGAVLGFVVPTIFTGLFSLFFIKDYIKPIPTFFNNTLKELCWFGFYVVMANSIGTLYTQIDSLMIGYFLKGTDVGYYAVAVVLLQGILLFPSAVQQVTTPALAEYYGKKDFKNIIKLMESTMLKTFLITLFFSGLIVLFGKFMISIFFTNEFLPAYIPLLILLIGYSIQAPMTSIGGMLSSIGKVKMIFKITAFSALINIILNMMFIPKFGIIGAACATTLSAVISVTINLVFIKKYVYDFATINYRKKSSEHLI